jgi:glycosyltransferase involved in cell wall biosynthesis
MNKKLNIAMICDPIGEYKAGAIVSAVRFSTLLEERGHKVIFIGAKTKEYPKEHDTLRGIKTYRFRSIPLPKSGGWYLAFPTIREIKKILHDEKIDIMHVILPMSGAIVAVKAAQSLGITIVAHSHSQPENLFMDMPKMLRPFLDSSWNRFLAWMYSKGEIIIYPSKMAHSLLKNLTEESKTSVVISNGVNTQEFKPVDTGDFCNRFNIPDDMIKLAYVGRLFPEKSIDTFIKSIPQIIEEHPHTHVMIIGGGYLRDTLEKLTHSLHIAKHVSFLGQVSDHDKLLAYNACDIFVSPSLAELEGMTILEAMACGKPIVVPDTEMNAAKYFVDGNGLLFETKNSKDLAEKIMTLINDTELRKKMGEVGLNNSKKYDIQESANLLEKTYYSALEK